MCSFAAKNLQYTSTSTAACSADFTTSSNFRSDVTGSFSLAETAGTDSRKVELSEDVSLRFGRCLAHPMKSQSD
jgi:hypothetical protein